MASKFQDAFKKKFKGADLPDHIDPIEDKVPMGPAGNKLPLRDMTPLKPRAKMKRFRPDPSSSGA